ncbi:hypothetical protein MIS45_06505 [Wielerella bovis]|uniref:hypothetical protein n=1 Tax=Wielerella bovis TaxID=2917790 RepID=UPI002018F224|nr:hypothetical protein [Wielerella bovis]ULJ68460.1 hypothetical protein MIS45_06505 [Wielerella bovis]
MHFLILSLLLTACPGVDSQTYQDSSKIAKAFRNKFGSLECTAGVDNGYNTVLIQVYGKYSDDTYLYLITEIRNYHSANPNRDKNIKLYFHKTHYEKLAEQDKQTYLNYGI